MADRSAASIYVRRSAGQAGINAVVDYANACGFRLTAVPSRRCVLLHGTATDLTAAFDPIPADLTALIESVLGPLPGPPPTPGFATEAVTSKTLSSLAASLGLPDGDGAGHCIGVLSFAGCVGHATLQATCAALDIAPAATAAHVISIDAAAVMPDDTILPIMLILAALVPKAKVVVYAAPPTLRGWIDALSAALHDADNRPMAICNAWLPPGPCATADTLTQQAAALGIHLCQATAKAGTHSLASPEAGHAWTGSAIDAAIQAATFLRAAPTAAVPPAVAPPPPRRRFDALTLSSHPRAALHRAYVAFETDPYPGPRAPGSLTVPWVLLPGSMATDIAAGADGSIWALSGLPALRGRALFHLSPLGWVPANAGGIALAVDGQGLPWMVDEAGALLRFTGEDWRIEHDAIQDVAISPQGAVWALSHDGAVLHRPAPTDDDQAPTWVEHTIHADRITLAPDGTPWIVTRAGQAKRHHGAAWITEAANVHDIAIDAHGAVWVVSRCGRRLYRRLALDHGWMRGDGVADRLATQPGGNLWAITPHGLVAVAHIADEPAS